MLVGFGIYVALLASIGIAWLFFPFTLQVVILSYTPAMVVLTIVLVLGNEYAKYRRRHR
jgi:hypothetical protein